MITLLKSFEVANRLDIGMTTFKAVVKHQPDFPKPIKLSPKSHPKWRDVDIDAYLEKKVA